MASGEILSRKRKDEHSVVEECMVVLHRDLLGIAPGVKPRRKSGAAVVLYGHHFLSEATDGSGPFELAVEGGAVRDSKIK